MSNEYTIDVIDRLTTSYFSALGFVATIILGMIAFVFWDRRTYKRELEKEIEIKVGEATTQLKVELRYYFLDLVPFNDEFLRLHSTLTDSGISMIYKYQFTTSIFESFIHIFEKVKGNELEKFFKADLKHYYSYLERIIFLLNSSQDLKDNSQDEGVIAFRDNVNREYISKINNILQSYGEKSLTILSFE